MITPPAHEITCNTDGLGAPVALPQQHFQRAELPCYDLGDVFAQVPCQKTATFAILNVHANENKIEVYGETWMVHKLYALLTEHGIYDVTHDPFAQKIVLKFEAESYLTQQAFRDFVFGAKGCKKKAFVNEVQEWVQSIALEEDENIYVEFSCEECNRRRRLSDYPEDESATLSELFA